ncbi:3'-5' exonuclease [Conchiformibius steedae]|uniref:DNA-directed DNA polymerase n=1 Tax=Conchiformibius steedae TaxID=153493 RepID=A0A3P2A6K9_9NEIS|nr:3'-5' exonuclease [Conchiformibius steedae]RRD90568.1 3'-5' exonuclease [Conchiformibius steedae]
MLRKLRLHWEQKKLADPKFAFLYDETAGGGEMVSIDCETTGLDVKTAEIISIGAVKIRENRVLAGEPFYVLIKPEGEMAAENISVHGLRPQDLSGGLPIQEALLQLLDFIGGRPLVGYYLEFDVAMLNKFLKPLIGVKLPNRQIEISSIYYRQEMKTLQDGFVDLRLEAINKKLRLPVTARHNALNDAVHAAVMYLCLQGRER